MSKFSFMSGDEIIPISCDRVDHESQTSRPISPLPQEEIIENLGVPTMLGPRPLRIDAQVTDISMSANRAGRPSVAFLTVTPDNKVRHPLRTTFNDIASFNHDAVFNDEAIFNDHAYFEGPVQFNTSVHFNGPIYIGGLLLTSQMLERLINPSR